MAMVRYSLESFRRKMRPSARSQQPTSSHNNSDGQASTPLWQLVTAGPKA